ncbi:hypothetical protein LTR04_005079, partial [Oleoguttula sp. CCFEE 6159]
MTNRTPSLAQAQSDGNVTSHHDAESREVLSTNSVDESEKIGGVGERKAPEVPPSEVKLDVPPNGGYGWSYGVFLAHYLDTKTFRGASSLDFAFVGGLSISQALLVSPIATICTRLYGTRTTLLIGVFFETVSLIGASFAKEIYQLFLSQGIAFGWGMGFLFVGSVGIVPQWFTTRRSLANGIATAGSGFGGLMYSLATNAMIQNISLGWAFRILGTLALVVNFICACLLKDRNKQVGSSQLAFDYCLFKRVEYLLLLGFGFFSMLGYIVLLFSLPNYASSIGLTPRQGSVIVGRINMAFAMTFLAGLFSLVIWVFASSYGVLIFYALIGGTVAGTFWTTIAPVTAEVVGLKDVPAALSITWLALVLPTTFSEPIALEITAANDGRYLGAQLFTGFMYIAAAICVWFLRAWKIGELEEIAAAEGRDPKGINVVTALPIAEAS